MPQSRTKAVLIVRIASIVAIIAVISYFTIIGLDKADKVASVIAGLLALITFVFPSFIGRADPTGEEGNKADNQDTRYAVLVVASLLVLVIAAGVVVFVNPGNESELGTNPSPAPVLPLDSRSPIPQVSATASISPINPAAGTPVPNQPTVPTQQTTRVGTQITNPYAGGQQRILLNDQMTNATPSRWSNLNPATGTCKVASDGMHAASNETSKYHECYNSTSSGNMTFEVTFTFSTARAAGLFVRQSGDGTWYFAEVGRSGTVWLSKATKGVSADPELFTGSIGNFNPGGEHRIAICATGNNLTVYVDGKTIGSITDNDFVKGSIGLFTDGGTAPDGTESAAEIIFRDARVWGEG